MSSISPRIAYETFVRDAAPVVAALSAMSRAVDASGLEKPLTELLKIRASQINGCAFCIQYHLNIARDKAVPRTKLDLVAAWHEAPAFFSERERAALAYTEALSAKLHEGVSDALYQQVAQQFPGEQMAFLTAAVANINAWNRIAVALRFAPPVRDEAS
ncbi:carboxymuconolactone decarboxylase family protein [Paraburkholderia unamae]|uniref:AhpD family alkylhydroperoxidase n=1 Tax=Paraburkholderia unamae TaxID=219649 RepID=A0ABX5KGW2_9BURK|nr:carboxymuconolactone decarboxylase family protein [Paraburkholderia unamae]PVX78769.1 AhpD family alkylhydroperoxidase [Paraburkholderia unamae]CAG9244115.1 Alkylhydroperoxidase [Paraburkholderia unamae]